VSNSNLGSFPKQGRSDLPGLSAIMVIPDKYETVKTTMNHLKKQTSASQIEIVFVVSKSDTFKPAAEDLKVFHSWKTVKIDEVNSIGLSFAKGITQASAPIIALTEDHSYPDIHWAELFIKDHQQPWAVVGPSMRNGNPVNLYSWADFYQAYGQWQHPIKWGKAQHLPGHNSSYKRDILLSLGSKLETFMPSESVLHRHLRIQGYELLLEANTCTAHLNFDNKSNWYPARYYAGRQFAGTWANSWPILKRLVYVIASPGIPWLRLWRTRKYIKTHPESSERLPLMFLILAGFIIEACGNAVGFISGVGDANQKIAQYEYHRIK
jgi:hypothetical protein